jgi:hypothetical protein
VFNGRYAARIFVPKTAATAERMDALWTKLTEFLYR